MMNMGNNTPESTMFDSKFATRVTDVEAVLQDMKAKAERAYKENDAIMLALYEDVCRVVSPIVTKYAARAKREELAAMNRNKKELKAKNKQSDLKTKSKKPSAKVGQNEPVASL